MVNVCPLIHVTALRDGLVQTVLKVKLLMYAVYVRMYICSCVFLYTVRIAGKFGKRKV